MLTTADNASKVVRVRFRGEEEMNRSLPTKWRAIAALLAAAVTPITFANAQSQGYQVPNFPGIGMPIPGGAQQLPAFPASPLAGGPAATQGGEFIDVEGRRIVLPASYCQSCPGGSCETGFCAPGVGGCGDPMAVDFGGYGQDQCGPHYFDVSADVVFLQAAELWNNVGPFSSAGVGANAPRYLNPNSSDDDFEPGWQISARYDVGALAVLEATYMGLYDIGFTDTVNSAAVNNGVPFSLFTSFSNFGTGTLVEGFDDGNVHTLGYQSDLQSTELSYRRYWVGTNPRVSGTWLVGARYLRMTEDFNFHSQALVGAAVESANRLWSSENDMVGFQFGGDGWYALRQGLRIGGEAKAGVYNNHFKFRHLARLPSDPDFNVLTVGDQVAFAAEGGAQVVADILPSWSVRGGYRVLYLNSLTTAGNSIDQSNINSLVVSSQAHALYHGFHGGIEYVW